MTTASIHLTLLGGATAGTVGVGLRISFQLGKIAEAFRKHVQDSDVAHADYEKRLRYQEYGGK